MEKRCLPWLSRGQSRQQAARYQLLQWVKQTLQWRPNQLSITSILLLSAPIPTTCLLHSRPLCKELAAKPTQDLPLMRYRTPILALNQSCTPSSLYHLISPSPMSVVKSHQTSSSSTTPEALWTTEWVHEPAANRFRTISSKSWTSWSSRLHRWSNLPTNKVRARWKLKMKLCRWR